jgi:DNA-binding SARP family transcriptional activator
LSEPAAGGLEAELAGALRSAAGLARRLGRFELAAELESRLVEEPCFRLELFGSGPRLLLERPGMAPQMVAFRLRRAFATLALLALEKGRQLSREALIEALWAEESVEAIKRNFHPVLSDLRRTLQDALQLALGRREEVLELRLGIYLLDTRLPLRIDAESFESRLAEAENAGRSGEEDEARVHLLAAWRLYRGPLLEGYEAEWLRRRREQLHRRYLQALRRTGELAMARGEDQLATDAFRSLLFEEPFDENVHLELMRLYARGGRRDLVRRQFVRLQENLKELDVEPRRASQEEFHRLMR